MAKISAYKSKLRNSISYLLTVIDDFRHDLNILINYPHIPYMNVTIYHFPQYLFDYKNRILWLGDSILYEIPKDFFRLLLFKTYIGLCKKIDHNRYTLYDVEFKNKNKYEEIKTIEEDYQKIFNDLIALIIDILENKVYDLKIIDDKLNKIISRFYTLKSSL